MKDFRTLKVWEKSHQLSLEVYKITAGFPKHEMFSLTSQMRRAAISVPSNIAEGCCRSSDAELARFLYISVGSVSELEYQTILARDLKYISNEAYESINTKINHVKSMLIAFIQKLQKLKA
ncbi:MAG TPA: four helix bundle protein [Patescibacteria group bacterium]|jgi:four helix bundle protein|nr:four helix bundle protein [Patescibacteria group bacterium]